MVNRFLSFMEFVQLIHRYEVLPSNAFNQIFGNLIKLFDGTYDNPYYENPNDPTDTMKLPKYMDMGDLLDYLMSVYDDRSLYPKWKEGIPTLLRDNNAQFVYQIPDEEEAYNILARTIIATLDTWVSLNSDRIIRTLGALQLKYNPIENYSMTEQFKDTPTGTKTNTRSFPEDLEIHNIEVTAPLSSVSIDKDADTGKFTISNASAVASKDIESEGKTAAVNDTRAGKKIKDNTTSVEATESNLSTSLDEGAEPTTKNYVTTFDSDDEHLNTMSNTSGDSAGSSQSASWAKTQQSAVVKISQGNNQPGYTDTETYSNYSNSKDGWRKGNVGVTTSQQMLESEIVLRSKPVVEDFLREALNQIFLQVLV